MIKQILSFLSVIIVSGTFAQTVCAPEFFTPRDTISCNDSTMIIFNSPGGSETFSCPQFDILTGNPIIDPATGVQQLGPCDPVWATNPGVEFGQPHYPSPDGNGYLWMGNQISSANGNPRTVTSPSYNTSCGGQICFDFIYGDGNTNNSEQPDLYNEGVELQYQIPGGPWESIRYWAPNGTILPANPDIPNPGLFGPGPFEVWQDDECVDIPLVAQLPSVRFRFFQEFDTDLDFDHWGIDDIEITINADQMQGILSGVFDVNGLGQPFQQTIFNNAPADTLWVSPLETTRYEFVVTDANSGGTYVGFNTLWIYVRETDAGPISQLACDSIGTELSVNGVMPFSNIVWTPNLAIDDVNSHTPFVDPPGDTYYTVTSDCGVDSVLVDIVANFNPILSTSSDSICVGETVTLTANTNAPASTYTYNWTPATVDNDTIMTTGAFPSTNTTYYVEMVSDVGCVREDSITIFVGAIPKTIDYIGDLNLCRGDSTQVTVVPTQPTFFDDFELGANPSIWATVENGLPNTDCGSIVGNTLHFDGTGPRGVETFPVDASLGGNLSFYLIYGSTFGVSPCSDMGFNDGASLEYSTDGGVTWVNITTYAWNGFDNFTLVQETLPAGAQTANTILRLWQPQNGGQDQDNWAIDEFLLELECSGTNCVNYAYEWVPATNISDVNVANPFFYPPVSTYYAVSISPEGFDCSTVADSIFIEVDELDISITPSDTFLCEPTPLLLEATIDGFANSCEEEYAISQTPLNMLTGGTPSAVILGDDAMSASIQIPFGFEFYCEEKTSFGISSNGFITFSGSTDNGCCQGDFLPTANTFNPSDLIALLWSDLHGSQGSASITHFVTGAAPNRIQVVEFDAVPNLGSLTQTVTGQIQLYETSNIVEIHCVGCETDGTLASIGLENSNGTVGHTPPGYNQNNTLNVVNEGWRFIPTNSPANFNFGWTPNLAISNDSVTNPIITPTTSTDYVFSVRNINNCLFTDTAKIGIYESNLTLTADIIACAGDSIQLLATGADTYSWTSNIVDATLNDTSISNPLSGTLEDVTYTVTYDTEGCEETREVFVDILNLPPAMINNNISPVPFCEGESVDLFVDNNINGWSFTWSGPENGVGASINVSTPGTYEVEYDDGNCINKRSVVVTTSPTPFIDLSLIDSVLCCNSGDYEVNLNSLVTNTTVDEFYVNGNDEAGNTIVYTALDENGNQLDVFKVRSTDGCETEDIYVNIATNCLNPMISSPDTVYSNAVEMFDLSTVETNADNVTYAWTTTDASTGAIVTNTAEDAIIAGTEGAEGFYTANVAVTATYGIYTCMEEAEARDYEVVTIPDPLFPDAFTPNGDGLNDIFRAVVNPLAEVNDFRVYNRWGDKVYDMSTATNKEGWDGNWSGKKQPSDQYTYFIKITNPGGEEFLEEGPVSLIR